MNQQSQKLYNEAVAVLSKALQDETDLDNAIVVARIEHRNQLALSIISIFQNKTTLLN